MSNSKGLKKIIAGALALTMLLSMSVTSAFAATLDEDNPTGDALVVYQAGKVDDNNTPDNPEDDIITGTYEVVIPEYIMAAPVGGTPEAEQVIAKNVLIPYDTALTVSVAFDDELDLVDGLSSVTYDFMNNGAKIATGDTILTVEAGDPDSEFTTDVSAILTSAPLFAGAYTDTATFTIAVA